MSWNHSRRFALFALAAVVVGALVLRLWRIDSLPPGFHFDESFEGMEAWRILTDPTYRPVFLTGNFGVAPVNSYANAVTFGLFRLFGGEAGPTAMRVTAAVFGTLGVVAAYALAREVRYLDPRRLTLAFPLLAAAMLATMRWHIHFSRMGIEPILVPLLWASATFLLLRGWRLRSWISYSLCGVVLAAAMYSYQGAWIVPFLMVPVVCHLWLVNRRAHDSLRPLAGPLLSAGIALLLVLPLGWFFARNPDLLILRPAQIAVTGAETGPQTGTAATPLENAFASALMFAPLGQTGDIDPRRNLPGEAALNWWQFLPFAAGALLALWRVRNPAYSTLLVGLVGLLLPGVFSEYAPHFHRILGATVPTALLCALGLDALLHYTGVFALEEHGSRRRGWLAAAAAASVALLILGGAVVGARDYFVRWAALPNLFYAFDTGLWQIGQEIARQPADEPAYLSPRPADHPTLAFALAVQQPPHAAPTSFDGRQVLPMTAGPNAEAERYYVIEHEDFRTPLLLPELLPQVQVEKTIDQPDGTPYAKVYVRPAGTAPQRPPEHAVGVALNGAITLQGYDVQPAKLHPGEILYLQLHWLVNAQPDAEWTTFTHLLRVNADGSFEQVAGHDSPPGGGTLPTSRWQEGWRVLDEYQISLPADLAPGAYTLAAGLYQPDGTRLPPEGPGVLLGEVTID